MPSSQLSHGPHEARQTPHGSHESWYSGPKQETVRVARALSQYSSICDCCPANSLLVQSLHFLTRVIVSADRYYGLHRERPRRNGRRRFRLCRRSSWKDRLVRWKGERKRTDLEKVFRSDMHWSMRAALQIVVRTVDRDLLRSRAPGRSASFRLCSAGTAQKAQNQKQG